MSNDALLAEYLRVINDKDERIHQLLVEIEKLQLAQKRKDDSHKRHLKEIEGVIESLKSSVQKDQSQEAEIASLRKKNRALQSDVDRLNEAFKKSEADMASIAKDQAKWKKHEDHAKEKMRQQFDAERANLEKTLSTSASRVAVLESQVELLQGSREVGDKDALRWKVEAQRLSEELADATNANRELRRKTKEMTPLITHEAALAQAEVKHQAQIHSLDRAVASLQKDLQEERLKSNSAELRLRDAEHRISETVRQNDQLRDAVSLRSAEIAEVRLEKQQSLADHKASSEQNIQLLQQQLDRYYTENVSLDGELKLQRQRVGDLESAASQAADRFKRDEAQLSSVAAALRSDLADSQQELATAARQLDHLRLQTERDASRIGELEGDLRNAEAEIRRLSSLQNQLLATKKAEQEQRFQIQTLESQAARDSDVITEIREENAQLRRDVAAATLSRDAKSKESSDQVRRLQEQLREREDELEETHQKLRAASVGEAASASTVAILEAKVERQRQLLGERDETEQQLRRDANRMSEEMGRLQGEVQQLIGEKESLQADLGRMEGARRGLLEQLHSSQLEMDEVNSKVRRAEQAAADHEGELRLQLESARTRSQGLAQELHNVQQALNLAKIDIAKGESSSAELASKIQSLSTELGDRVQRVSVLEEQVTEARSEKERLLRAQRIEVERLSSTNQELESQVVGQREDHTRRIRSLEKEVSVLSDELRKCRDANADQGTELLKRRSEVATWQERCANLESLKRISDGQVEDFQRRERDLMEKIDLLQDSQQEMQVLFERQNRQVEMGRRLREERS